MIALAFTALIAADARAWTEIHRTRELVVSTRPRAGSAVNEMRAVAVVDAPADALWALVRDVEGHTALVPDTTVSRILRTDGDDVIVLQRSQPAVLDAREYVIAVRVAHETLADGRVRRTLSWRVAPAYAAHVDPDAVRIDVNEGFWSVEPLRASDGPRSRVTFQLLLDPAGSVPAALVNFSQRFGVQQALATLTRHAAREPRPRVASSMASVASVAPVGPIAPLSSVAPVRSVASVAP